MKAFLLGLLVLTLSSNVFANEEVRTYKKVSATEATVTIKSSETDWTQAAGYVDAKENEKFIDDLLKDPASPLYKLAREIEREICGTESTPESSWIETCGEVTITKEVKTSFARAGWASAGSSYTFFIGFTSDGTGRFFDVSHMVTIGESTEAQTNEDYEYSGTVIKTLSLIEIKKLERDSVL